MNSDLFTSIDESAPEVHDGSSSHHLGISSWGGSALNLEPDGERNLSRNKMAFGQIRSEDTSTSFSPAIRPMNSTQITTWRKLKKEFIREMRLIAKLRHPCITTVMGMFWTYR